MSLDFGKHVYTKMFIKLSGLDFFQIVASNDR
jgi:hypothetical protein